MDPDESADGRRRKRHNACKHWLAVRDLGGTDDDHAIDIEPKRGVVGQWPNP